MIQLTPLEESVAVKELIQQGMEKGQIVGQIQLIQRLLKIPQTPDESLAQRPIEELKTLLADLEAKLSKNANIF